MWLHWDTLLFSKPGVIAPSGINQNYLSQIVCFHVHFSIMAEQQLGLSEIVVALEGRQRSSNAGDGEMVKEH